MIPALFLTPLFKIGGTVALVAFMAITWKVYINSVEERGATKAVAKIEKANKNAVKKADEVGRKSRDPAARGLRDPNYTGN